MADVVTVNVTKPEDWPAAVDVKGQVRAAVGRSVLTLDARGISRADWDAIVAQTDPGDKATDAEKERQLQRRYVAVMDLCWKPIPGETLDAKYAYICEQSERAHELEALAAAILSLSGTEAAGDSGSDAAQLVATPEEWLAGQKAARLFRSIRAGVELVFSVRGCPDGKWKLIKTQTEPGDPPREPVREPDGRMSVPLPNPNNKDYQANCARLQNVRHVLALESTLGFPLPGTTVDEKCVWLSARPVFEVRNLVQFAVEGVGGVQDLAGFFALGSRRQR
jgi:hypothetical protein